MTPTTTTPFVNTPFGVGVVEVSSPASVFSGFACEYYVRFEDGERRWVAEADCKLDAPRPDWYREPETALIAGWVS